MPAPVNLCRPGPATQGPGEWERGLGCLRHPGDPKCGPLQIDVTVSLHMGRGLLLTVMTSAREYVAVGECECVCTCVHLVVSGRVWVNECKYICACVPLLHVRSMPACVRQGDWVPNLYPLPATHLPQTLELAGAPSVPLVIGCAVSCMALLTLLAIYAAFWR